MACSKALRAIDEVRLFAAMATGGSKESLDKVLAVSERLAALQSAIVMRNDEAARLAGTLAGPVVLLSKSSAQIKEAAARAIADADKGAGSEDGTLEQTSDSEPGQEDSGPTTSVRDSIVQRASVRRVAATFLGALDTVASSFHGDSATEAPSQGAIAQEAKQSSLCRLVVI